MPDVLSIVTSWQFVVLALLLGSATWVHYRGQVRHAFVRQLFDHSTFFAPINCVMYAFSAVPTGPRVPVEAVPALRVLRENWQVFRDEALALNAAGDIRGAGETYDDIAFNSFFRRGWRRFYLTWYGRTPASARQHCPRTVEILSQVPGINGAMFAVLPVGGRLMKHRDPYAGSLRYHLGLVTPNDDRCRIWIDGDPYSWRDGEDVLFDETYIHAAENEAESDRIILFVDVARPLTNAPARWLNRLFSGTVMRAAASRNEADEGVGAVNTLFRFIYPIRALGKRIKRANRTGYYVLKYALFGGLLVLILA